MIISTGVIVAMFGNYSGSTILIMMLLFIPPIIFIAFNYNDLGNMFDFMEIYDDSSDTYDYSHYDTTPIQETNTIIINEDVINDTIDGVNNDMIFNTSSLLDTDIFNDDFSLEDV